MKRKVLLVLVGVFLIAGCVVVVDPPEAVNPVPPVEERLSPIEATILQCEAAAEHVRSGPSTSWERPDFGFPNQVLSPGELVVGNVYVKCNMMNKGEGTAFRLDSEPYVEMVSESQWALRVKIYYLDLDFSSEFFLSDYGVVPYEPSGAWNRTNMLLHLLPVGTP